MLLRHSLCQKPEDMLTRLHSSIRDAVNSRGAQDGKACCSMGPLGRSLSAALGVSHVSTAVPKMSFLRKALCGFDPALSHHTLSPPMGLHPLLIWGSGEMKPTERQTFPPLQSLCPCRAARLTLKSSGICFSVQAQPNPWLPGLSVMNFFHKNTTYQVHSPLKRRHQALSVPWFSHQILGTWAKDKANPPGCFPTARQVPHAWPQCGNCKQTPVRGAKGVFFPKGASVLLCPCVFCMISSSPDLLPLAGSTDI